MLRLALQELLVARARQRPERVSVLCCFEKLQLPVMVRWGSRHSGQRLVVIAPLIARA